jgi:hypothetical protein
MRVGIISQRPVVSSMSDSITKKLNTWLHSRSNESGIAGAGAGAGAGADADAGASGDGLGGDRWGGKQMQGQKGQTFDVLMELPYPEFFVALSTTTSSSSSSSTAPFSSDVLPQPPPGHRHPQLHTFHTFQLESISSHLLVGCTSKRIMLIDLRRPQAPLLHWQVPSPSYQGAPSLGFRGFGV